MKRLRLVLFALLLCLVGFGLLLSPFIGYEIFCRSVKVCRVPSYSFISPMTCRDLKVLPWLNTRTDCTSEVSHYVDNDLIYKVNVVTQDGFRVTPLPPGKKVAQVLFFGCSFTYGAGLEQSQTLPANLAKLMPVEAVNLAFPGGAPQHADSLLRAGALPKLSRLPAVGVFVYGPWQVTRVSGAPDSACGWGHDFPYFELGAGHKLVEKGTLADVCPFPRWTLPYLQSSALFLKFAGRFGRIPPHEIEVVAALIGRVRDEFLRKIPGSKFVVLFYPDHYHFDRRETLAAFRKNDLEVLDHSKLFDADLPQYLIAGDFHPSARAQAEVAQALAQDLKRLFPEAFNRRPRP